MSTQVFLLGANLAACDAWGPGDATWNPNAAFYATGITGNASQSLRLSRGAAPFNFTATSVGSSTARHRFGGGSGTVPSHWVSPPIDRDVTIASTITFNLWGYESSMSANCIIGCYVARISPDGTLSASIGDSTHATELGTSAAVRNWTQDATDLAVKRGDRLLIVPYFTNTGTMGNGFTITLDYNGPTAGADGDSYVTFTEDFGFMQDADQLASDAAHTFEIEVGNGAALQRRATSFVAPGAHSVTAVKAWMVKHAAPGDNLEVALQADSAGAPSGTDLASGSIAASSVTTSNEYTVTLGTPYTLTADTTYWLVWRRSGGTDPTNYISVYESATLASSRMTGYRTWSGSAWGSASTNFPGGVRLIYASTTLYPTTTAGGVDPNGATYDSMEVWTSRGSGVVNVSTAATAAPASPLLARVSGGTSNYIEWFSKQLQAFTLAGPVLVNVRGLEGASSANATIGCEIAVCNSDGTSPVVWGYTLHGGEIDISEIVRQFFVAGDDVAVADGQRLRVRFLWDDASNAAMAATADLYIYYAGTTGGASGDTYLTFGQTLAAKTFSLPHESSARRRLPPTVPVYA